MRVKFHNLHSILHNKIVQPLDQIQIISSNITVPSPDPRHSGQEFSTLTRHTIRALQTTCIHSLKIIKPRLHSYIHQEDLFRHFLTSSPNSQTCPSFKVNFHPISKSLKLLHSWKSRTSTLPTLLTTAQFRISITFSKSSNAFSYFVTGHSSHLLPYSIHTSRHTAKTSQQKLQALLFTLNNIRHSSVRGKFTNLISLNLSSAFDTIDHHLLLERHKNYVRCHWFSSELAQDLPHWPYSVSQTGDNLSILQQAYLRVQLHRLSLRPSFHPSTALLHSLGSINNNMLTTPNCA